MVKRMSAEALLLVTVVIYAFNFSAAMYALDNGFEPLSYSSVRFVIAAGAFTMLTWSRERSLSVARVDLKWLSSMALFGVVFNQLVFSFALDRASASSTSLIFGTFAIFVALIASAVRTEEDLSGAQIGGGAVIALGIVIARGLKPPRLRASRLGSYVSAERSRRTRGC